MVPAYLLSITKIVNSTQQIGNGSLVIVNNYILVLVCGIYSIYLLDSYSKDKSESDNLSSLGTPVLLKSDTLHSLEN